MTIVPKLWCLNLYKKLRDDNTIEWVGGRYSVDGKLFHCKLAINDGYVSFLVSFSINAKGYVLSPVIQPESAYLIPLHLLSKDERRDRLRAEYQCMSYLYKYVDLKPSVEDFRDNIIEARRLWLNIDRILQSQHER